MPHFSNQRNFLVAVADGFHRAGCPPNSRVLLAVSGGLDSIALLDATRRLWTDKSAIAVAHLDHGIRPSSHKDLEFVRTLALNANLAFFCDSLPKDSLRKERGSLEEAARQHRYNFLLKSAKEFGTTSVATAHHKTDQAETVLHNILRGTGLRGLGGMQVRRDLDQETHLIRPLSDLARADLDEWANQKRLEYRIDETNAETQLTRNRLRLEVMPQLRAEFNPQLDNALANLAEQANSTVSVLKELCVGVLNSTLIERQPKVVRLHRLPLCNVSAATRQQLFLSLWDLQSWPKQKMSADHWKEVALLMESHTGRLELPGQICVTTTQTMVRFIES